MKSECRVLTPHLLIVPENASCLLHICGELGPVVGIVCGCSKSKQEVAECEVVSITKGQKQAKGVIKTGAKAQGATYISPSCQV